MEPKMRSNDLFAEGELDPKPFKVDRVTKDGELVSHAAEYETEAEAMLHKRRLDWHYRIYVGRGQFYRQFVIAHPADFWDGRVLGWS
jgi:hypothetical protein